MKHSIMRVAVAATLGLSALAANAGQIGVNVGATLAAEYLTATAAVTQPTITYQTASLINDGATVYFHVRFSAGSVAAPGALPAAGDITLFLAGNPYANATVGAITADADKLGYTVAITATVGAGGIPAGLVVNFNATAAGPVFGAAKIAGLTAALGSGGTVTTTVGYNKIAGDFSTVVNWVEAPSTDTLLVSKKALSQTTLTSGAVNAAFVVAESKKVDVGISSVLKKFDVTSLSANLTKANLGWTQLAVDTTLTNSAGGAAAVVDFGTSTILATGDFAGAGTATLENAVNCAGGAAVKSTATLSADKKTATFAGVLIADVTNAAGLYLCYNTSSATAIPYNVQFAIGGASVAAQAVAPATIASTVAGGGNVYKLLSNGAAVTVPSFVPSTGAAGTGYKTYLRVINTGNLIADINVAAVDPVTGVVGTPAMLKAQMPVGASTVLDSDAISSALGLSAGTWYSLLVTGATSSLAAQPLLVNPQGVITNVGSINGNNNNPVPGAASN